MFKSKQIKDLEAKIYEKIAKEMDEYNIQKGLWVRAKAEAKGNEALIESTYIKLRFEELKEKSIAHYKERVNKIEETTMSETNTEQR